MGTATYQYKVRNKYGHPSAGMMEGESREDVARRLETMGYKPVSIREKGHSPAAGIIDRMSRVNQEEITFFTRQLVTMLAAGLPITMGLSALREQAKNKYLAGIISGIARDIEAGSSFAEALSRHPHIFNELYVATVRVGEAAGILDEVLSNLADLREYEADTRAKIKTAVRYPLIVFVSLCIGALIMVGVVMPRFMGLFSRMEIPLPLPTKILIWATTTVQNYWYLGLIFLAVVIFVFRKYLKTRTGRMYWDSFKLRVPVFGPLIFKVLMARFARVTAMLMKSALPILQVLELVSRSMGNVVISRAINDIHKSVSEGKGMSGPMRSSGIFTPVVVQMVAVGEETGKVDELLFRVSEHYKQQVDYTVKNLTTLIEPVFVAILGAGVLLMALAVLLPMWNLVALLRK